MANPQRSLRHQRILGLFDQTKGRGLEIGPLFDPVVRRWESDVRYVDVHPGDVLKEYYSSHPGVPVADIVDPDYSLSSPDGVRTLSETLRGAGRFDWVVASHVIEHVPDIVGWLQEVADVLQDDGQVILAVPDRRFSFDADRDPTTVGEMLLAYYMRDRIPSVRAVYDHYSRAVEIEAADAWRGARPGALDRIHDLDFVRSQLRLAHDDSAYVDCHVWLFTPQSFVDQLAELARLDLITFVVDRIVPTAHNELEFYALLRRLPREMPASTRSALLTHGFQWHDLDVTGSVEPPGLDVPHPPVNTPADNATVLSPLEFGLIQRKRALMSRVRAAAAFVRRRQDRWTQKIRSRCRSWRPT